MEHGTIERDIHVEASPDVVFDVISRPEHMQEWWPDHAELEPVPGATGTITFGDPAAPGAATVPLTKAIMPYGLSVLWSVLWLCAGRRPAGVGSARGRARCGRWRARGRRRRRRAWAGR